MDIVDLYQDIQFYIAVLLAKWLGIVSIFKSNNLPQKKNATCSKDPLTRVKGPRREYILVKLPKTPPAHIFEPGCLFLFLCLDLGK